ncbi:HCR012Wp [Eremothecium sinecaudum]|uniref:HCR012Wp n=1 Tax=Eremothecium sinecaudum TaxID=45286 RepID=A0A109UWR2_9SACH|nr:HCR012Wp [Eremothecium sinecaudum]AMD20162.1 HCR012Wp [Eremothecium sinecaudum]
MCHRKLFVGVDVGGTNTDSVVIDPTRLKDDDRGVLAWRKTITTPDVSKGIESSLRGMLEDPHNNIQKNEIASLTIGTTHFINAVVERNASRLQKVAVIRLCGPYGRSLPPFGDFPDDLANIINAYVANIDGGNQVSGRDIKPLDEEELRRHCAEVRSRGIKAVAVIGTFANINNTHELRAGEIIREEVPGADVVLSHRISGIGFLERENATILNASIKKYGRQIISSFVQVTRRLGLNCTLLISQNDGTVLSADEALEFPIKTFSSGATNSMRGAAILCSADPDVQGKNVIVCDVGGTTTDVGQLLASGFPRQSATYSYVGGVRMNFSMPHVKSIGLGGGSLVRLKDGKITVGPESAGADIVNSALVFGGETIVATDVTVASRIDEQGLDLLEECYKIGDATLVHKRFTDEYKANFAEAIKEKLENVINLIKTAPDPVTVIFVGGGSFIAPSELDGASKVIKPPYSHIANAIGAAMGDISSELIEVKYLKHPGTELDATVKNMIATAADDAISKGALKETIKVVDAIAEAVPYVENVYSFKINVVGNVDYSRVSTVKSIGKLLNILNEDSQIYTPPVLENSKLGGCEEVAFDYENYRPCVENGEWVLSVIDVDFISIGAYILGCGGGGNTHIDTIELKHIIKNGGRIVVITLDEFDKRTNGEGRAINVGYCGSPTISYERLHGNEILEAVDLIEKWEGRTADAIFLFEIGGGNGLSGLWTAYKRGLPCLDLDLMGRAYPTQWQSLPSVINNLKGYPYVAVSDGNGLSFMVTSTVNDIQMERVVRDAIDYHGVQCASVEPSMSVEQMKNETIHNPISLSWRIGRAVYIARSRSDLDNLPNYLIDTFGGDGSAKCLMRAKIIAVDRRLNGGYGYGNVRLESVEDSDITLRIPFKNENIVAYKKVRGGAEIPICSVPDLITLIDTDGCAIGTQDYRYGLEVFVMAFAPSDKWSTPMGIEIGGPKGFGKEFEDLNYNPIGTYVQPISVVDEFGTQD